jgi:hypothetical protein
MSDKDEDSRASDADENQAVDLSSSMQWPDTKRPTRNYRMLLSIVSVLATVLRNLARLLRSRD